VSTLTLVRHGQATPFKAVTDDLSELGAAQAAALGDYWVRRSVAFDAVYCGTLVRHRKTERGVADAYRAARSPWPEAAHDAGLNEYDGDGITRILAPLLAERDASFREALEASRAHANTPERNRYFQRMFERVAAAWRRGEIEHPDVEPWAAFYARVTAALKGIMREQSGNRRVAVFTSGGPIGVAVQSVLGAPEESAIALNWRVRNCSLTEFVYGGERVSLDAFNSIAHFEDPALHSFR
jgi:broad specificity phosphatase PhoE